VLTPGIIDDGSFTEEEKQADHRARRTMLGVVGLLAVCAALGVFLAFNFVQAERARTLQQWQVRLGIVADSRSADVSQWLDQQFSTMRNLAQNASLQMYVGGLTAGAKDTQAVEGGYLRNLLTVAEAVAISALERKESRGAHFRDDYPDKSEEAAKFNLCIKPGPDGSMVLTREPLSPMTDEMKQIIEEMKS